MSSKKVTKYDLVESVYQNTQCEKKIVQDVVEQLLDEIKLALKNGNTIELRGFGTFELRLRKGRSKARNPKTGEQLTVAPHYVAAFRSGQELKKALWELPVSVINQILVEESNLRSN
ncbi:HU family DNA-binding protein [Treponema pectinovorum]|uniref:HU family DNA-binding protein n=1 Tax=Treponema pectinovorum TaxID=164 RepID=UPI0011C88C9D|nr:HU family DNA-binding protein [Treponema pectinovorum]